MQKVSTICFIAISLRRSNLLETRSVIFLSFNIDIIYMTFRKLTDQDKIKLEEFKQKHGSTNLGSYRALLMRGTDPNQAIEIINKRSSLQPIAEAPPKAQPKKGLRSKSQFQQLSLNLNQFQWLLKMSKLLLLNQNLREKKSRSNLSKRLNLIVTPHLT